MNTRIESIAIALIASSLLLACNSTPDAPEEIQQSLLDDGSSQADGIPDNREWRCEANPQQQWRCLEHFSGEIREAVAETPLNPTVSTLDPALHRGPAAPVVGPAAAINTTPAATVHTHVVDEPLNRQIFPAQGYVVQLLAARQQTTIDDFRARHPRLDVHQLTIKKNDEHWQLLVVGPFASVAAAKTALAELETTSLADTPWIRSLRGITPLLIEATAP